uniref:Palmitoyltransferase n=1 Tax=Timema bartmani TaxID=61472 RepID=A0A7R9ER98_9NEOP|nr:unnamed protein product [Timema bartmani]
MAGGLHFRGDHSILRDYSDRSSLGHMVANAIIKGTSQVERIAGIMSTFQDRLRVPWRGGAKQISMDSLLPIVLQPLLAYIAAQNVWCTLLVFVSIHICIFYMYNIFMKFLPRTKFFLMWTLTSIVLLMTVFEVNVVPLMEILPEENFVLIVFVVAALACAYKVRSRAPLNHVPHTDPVDATGMVGNGKATEEVCSVCRKRVPPRTFHCRICQACVTKRDHHCVWFDCCVGEHNHLLFVLSLLLSVLALVYGAILTLTTVCHPVFFMDVILLPDDCSDVYHDFQIALCFVSAVYCLVLATLLLGLLCNQCMLISLGETGQEWRMSHTSCCRPWKSDRPYSRGIVRNWLTFVSCQRLSKKNFYEDLLQCSHGLKHHSHSRLDCR